MTAAKVPALLCLGLLAGCPAPRPYDDGAAGDGAAADLRPDQRDPNSWAMAFLSDGAVSSSDLMRDSADNVYLAGSFYKLTAFGPTLMTPADGNDLFLASVDPAGKVRWARRYGGAGSDMTSRLARDSKGNLYITGTFTKQATFGAVTLTSSGSYDSFFAKFDPAGKPLWARSAGGKGDDRGQGITADGAGNVYVVGDYYGTATFGNSTLTSKGGHDLYVARLTAGGAYTWIKSAGGAKTDRAQAAAATADGQLLVTGYVGGEASFGAAKIVPSGAGHHDLFVARYAPDGAVTWARSAGGLGTDYGLNIAVDPKGDSTITGQFEKVATFGTLEVSSRGGPDVFVARLDAAGTFVWVTAGGGSSIDRGVGIATDSATGAVYVTGAFLSKEATFGASTIKRAGDEDAFVARVNTAGVFDWAVSAGGDYLDGGHGVAVGPNGTIHATGYFRSKKALFGGHALDLGSQIHGVYVWKFKAPDVK